MTVNLLRCLAGSASRIPSDDYYYCVHVALRLNAAAAAAVC